MTLIKCKECGKEVSDKAEKCPNCGCQVIRPFKQYCSECGNGIKENETICSHCGCPVASYSAPAAPVNNYSNVNGSTKYNPSAVAGFTVSMVSLLLNFWGIVGLVALILSIVGLTQINNNGEKGRGLAITGTIVGAISVLYGFIIIVQYLNM